MVIGSILLIITMLSAVLIVKRGTDITNREVVHRTMQQGDGMEQNYPDLFIGIQLQQLY